MCSVSLILNKSPVVPSWKRVLFGLHSGLNHDFPLPAVVQSENKSERCQNSSKYKKVW